MVNKSKTKKRLILFIVIALLILALLICCVLKMTKKDNTNDEDTGEKQSFEEFAAKYEQVTVLPRNIYTLYSYKGDYDRDHLYKNMKKFVDYLDYLNQNVDINDTEDFYNQKSKEIKDTMGLENLTEFNDFMNILKNKNIQTNDLDYIEIIEGSTNNTYKYFEFDINIYYKDGSEPVLVHVQFANQDSNPIDLKYTLSNQ